MENAAYNVESAFAVKQIIAGGTYTTRKVTILSGQNLVAGSGIGPVLDDAVATVTPGAAVSGSGGTVGNGSIGTVTVDDGAMAGTWYVRITNPASNDGSFIVERPDGTIDGAGSVGDAYNGQLNFTLADGANDWVEDDYIPVVVSYASKKYKLSLAAATDGSKDIDFFLAQDCDASAGDKEALAYETGQIVGSALTLGTGHTVASIRDACRLKGLIIDD